MSTVNNYLAPLLKAESVVRSRAKRVCPFSLVSRRAFSRDNMRQLVRMFFVAAIAVFALSSLSFAQQRCPQRPGAGPNWCRPQQYPNIPGTPSPRPNDPQPRPDVNVPQGGSPLPADIPVTSLPPSNACHVPPNSGCYWQVLLPAGSQCFCLDAWGNSYPGTIW
jgi:hypothetical protein